MYVHLTCVPRIQSKIKRCFVSRGEHQMIISKKWITRLQSRNIMEGKKGLRCDNEDVNWALLMLIRENDFAIVQWRSISAFSSLPCCVLLRHNEAQHSQIRRTNDNWRVSKVTKKVFKFHYLCFWKTVSVRAVPIWYGYGYWTMVKY